MSFYRFKLPLYQKWTDRYIDKSAYEYKEIAVALRTFFIMRGFEIRTVKVFNSPMEAVQYWNNRRGQTFSDNYVDRDSLLFRFSAFSVNNVKDYTVNSLVLQLEKTLGEKQFVYQVIDHTGDWKDEDLYKNEKGSYKQIVDFDKIKNLYILFKYFYFSIVNYNEFYIFRKPLSYSLNGANQLHCDTGPALVFPDGCKLYYLNGVRMLPVYVETGADKLDPNYVLIERNSEVRRELIRKIGLERLVAELGAKSLEKKGDYELVNFDIIDGSYRPFLKMKNPSIDAWHIEGVHPSCRTIQQALAWRDGDSRYEPPVILT